MSFRSALWLLLPALLLPSFARGERTPAARNAPRPEAAGAPTSEARKGRPWLGLSIEKGLTGVRVREVMADSPCANVDVRAGDEVLALDEARVQTPTQLIAAVQKAGLGAKVALLVRSAQGQERKVPVTLSPRPNMGEWQRQGLLGKAAPTSKDFSLKVLGGPELASLEDLRGQVVLLDFFTSWCGPCMAALPELQALAESQSTKGLRVIGVSAETEEVVRRVIRERRIPYTVAMDVGELLSRAYRIHAFPTLFVIDRQGVIRAVTNDVEEAEQAARSLLGEGALSPPVGGRGKGAR